MRAALVGLLVGLLVVLDPFVTAYLLRDVPQLRDVPYLLSLAAASCVGAAFFARAFSNGITGAVVFHYYRYFPFVFLLAYQLNGVAAGPLDATEAVIGAFLLLFLAAALIRPAQTFVATPFNMLHVALGICIVLSLLSEVVPFAFLKSPKPFVVFLLLVNFLARDDLALRFLRSLVVLAALSAGFCLVQEAVWLIDQQVLSVVPDERLDRMFEDTPLGPVFRVPGAMVSYRSMAQYLAAALMLVTSALLWREHARLLARRWLVLALLLIVPALLLTLAKDILIGTVLGIGLLFVLRRPQRLIGLSVIGLVGALAIGSATLVAPGNVDTALDLTRTIPKTEQERIRLDRDSIEGFLHGPYVWTGRGIGAGARYTAHVLGWPAHNSFILVAAELGLAGLAVYLTIYALAFMRLLALNMTVRSGPYLPAARALLAIYVVILVGAQFEASFLDIFVWAIFATVEALWLRLRREALATTSPHPSAAGART